MFISLFSINVSVLTMNGYFHQVQAERDISGVNFPKGVINFRFQVPQHKLWFPSKSYFRVRVTLKTSNGAQFLSGDSVGPAMYLCDNLFQQMNARVNGAVVSEIGDYCAQIGALRDRQEVSETRRKALGNYLNFNHPLLSVREQEIQKNGKDATFPVQITKFVNQNSATLTSTDADFRWFQPINSLNTADFTNKTLGFGPTTIGPAGTTTTATNRDLIFVGGQGTQYTGGVGIISSDVAGRVNFAGINSKLLNATDWWVERYLPTRGSASIELIWIPPLGVFHQNKAVPGDVTLQFFPLPNANMQRYVIETYGTEDATRHLFTVEDMMLYNFYEPVSTPLSDSYTIICPEIRCQSQVLTTSSLTTKTFVVNPMCTKLTLALQSQKAESDDSGFSRTKFICDGKDHLRLERFYIKFNGLQLPQPIPDILATFIDTDDTDKTDYTAQQYYEALVYNHMIRNQNAPEDLTSWKLRGPYYSYSGFGQAGGTRAYVSTKFTKAFSGNNNPAVLLFDHFPRASHITVKDGVVLKVVEGIYD